MLLKYHFWKREKEDAEDMLRNIGADDAALQTILGPQYAHITTALEHGADIDRPRTNTAAKRSAEVTWAPAKRPRH